MKQLILFLCVSSASLFCSAQNGKLYAYSQETRSGLNPKTIMAENGKEIKSDAGPKVHYLIYLENKNPLKVTGLWIKGRAYNFVDQEILKTPVVLEGLSDPNMERKQLVPATSNKVYSIATAGPAKSSRTPAILGKLIKSSDVVVSYKVNGKTSYSSAKKIQSLPAAVAM
jgi:hypothetical protein